MSTSPKLSRAWLREGLRRVGQLLSGWAILDFPGLTAIRMFILRRMFSIDEKVLVGKDCYFIVPHGLTGGYLRIGAKSKLNHGVEIDYSGGVTIGSRVWVSQNVLIETHEHVIGDGDKESWEIITSPLLVDDEAWIGANAIILPSVSRIGRRAIVGAGSVVTRDVPDGAIVVGSPARQIRTTSGQASA